MPAPRNPSYSASSNPPAYSDPANRPAPPPRPTGAPTSYGSLADLTRGNAKVPSAPPPIPSERPSQGRTASSGWAGRQNDNEGEARSGRRLPPPPPRRDGNASSTAPANSSGYSSYIPASAQGYANTAGGYLSSAGSRAKDGLDTVVNQQTKDQVLSGAGKLAGGAIKLGGKAVWSAGKFVANVGNR
ncbi:hypothetical protein BCR39DRAFT_188127 [Naematelia encephala]|uniref:Uncharacterized protein n=1 Tax=Naematelia encephala TaxID=71784 RepID=A0A1Y2B201_9TREE|nr:hypothetical protein BCR39DRAFT_188127 [Naematelia encephala]